MMADGPAPLQDGATASGLPLQPPAVLKRGALQPAGRPAATALPLSAGCGLRVQTGGVEVASEPCVDLSPQPGSAVDPVGLPDAAGAEGGGPREVGSPGTALASDSQAGPAAAVSGKVQGAGVGAEGQQQQASMRARAEANHNRAKEVRQGVAELVSNVVVV